MARSSKARRPAVAARGVRYPTWTLRVEGFGKIRSATVKMAPLVLLVGKNNTGKSHIASLIWGLMNSERLIFSRGGRNKPVPEWFSNILFAASNDQEDVDLEIKHDERQAIERDINIALKERKDALVRQLLSYDDVAVRRIEVRLDEDSFPRWIRSAYVAGASHGNFSWGNPEDGYDLKLGLGGERSDASPLDGLFYNFLMSGTLSGGLSFVEEGGSAYIPAARTGLMLAFRSLVSALIDKLGLPDNSSASPAFPLPIIRFLQALNDSPRSADARFSKIAQSLEKEILHGSIKAGNGVTKEFSYVSGPDKLSLPLHVSSSMVTELAPFLILLKSGQLRNGVVFEEPEAHLHLSAQRSVARAIARLVNAGVPVVVTTHSDTFLQQMNISMQLYSHPRRAALCKAFGYSKDEVLNPDMARAYEFVSEQDETIVKELQKSIGGFVVPSLNQPLESLSTEVLAMDNR